MRRQQVFDYRFSQRSSETAEKQSLPVASSAWKESRAPLSSNTCEEDIDRVPFQSVRRVHIFHDDGLSAYQILNVRIEPGGDSNIEYLRVGCFAGFRRAIRHQR
jgi:hypothetical protein